jgi:hopanoid biosynthesis associated RND transporter like protein HpnN
LIFFGCERRRTETHAWREGKSDNNETAREVGGDASRLIMIETAILKIFRVCTARPALTLLFYLLLTLGAVLFTSANFAIHTDTSQLISSRLPWRQRELQLDAAFPQQVDTLLVVVDGATPELADRGAKRLAAALANDRDHFAAVHETAGGPFFEHDGLLFLSTEEVQHAIEQLIRAQPFLGTLAADPTLRGLAQALSYIPKGVQQGAIEAQDFEAPLTRLSTTIDALLAGRPASFSWGELMTGEAPAPRELRRFISVKPVLDFDDLQPGSAASETIRKTAGELGLTKDKGVSVRLTGPVAMADDEFGTVADGALLNVILTVVAVLLILWFALRSGRLMFAVMLSLFVGLAITAALGLAMVGALNLISVAFAVLFVGIGVDFGIQVAVRYRQERHFKGDLQGALAATAARIAKPLTLAATATAAGFYAFLPTDYRGVSELGLISGTGMIVAFVISITLLPALLLLLKPPPEPEGVGYRKLAPVDRFMARHRVPILILAALAVAAGLPLFRDLKFDFNPLNLRSAKMESVATLLDLMKDPETSPNVINVLTPAIEEAASLAKRLDQLPEVSSSLTLQSFVPKEQDEKLAIIADAEALLEPTLDPPEVKAPPSDAETRAALNDAANAFVSEGKTDASAAIAKSLKALAESDATQPAAVETALLGGLKLRLEQIRASLHPEPVTLANLPDDLRQDWISKDGQARVEVKPKGDQIDNETMRRFAAAVLEVAPDATGTPILIQESAKTIVRAFLQAGALALLLITLTLFFALRRATDVLVTLVPLLLAGVVTLELTVLFGLPLNFANIIALPLLLGVGVAFKIYYVLAWREGETSLLASSLTRAVLFSALTTASAFASLWLSNHPGTSSMGKLLSLSLVTTLVAAVLFQPILMGPPRQVKEGAGPARKQLPEPVDSPSGEC